MYVEILLMRMLFCWFCKASLEIPKLKYKLLSNYFSCIKFGVLKLFTFPIFYSFFFVTGKQNGLKLFLLRVCLFEWMSSIRNRIGLSFLYFVSMPRRGFPFESNFTTTMVICRQFGSSTTNLLAFSNLTTADIWPFLGQK